MHPILKLIAEVQRSVSCASATYTKTPPTLARPGRLASLIARGEERRLKNQNRFGVPIPRFCIFSVTWRCNLNCVGCYAKNYVFRGDLPLQEIRRVITESCDLGAFFFIIAGGEPLLMPGLIDVLAEIRDGLFFLFTNGTMLQAGHAEAIARAANILPIVSIEGVEQFTDRRRGEGTGRKVAEAMQTLRRAEVPFGLSTMATHPNVELVTSRRWFNTMWDAGARFAFLVDYIPFPRNYDASLVLTDEDRALKAEALKARGEEGRPLVMNFPPDEYADGGCQSAGLSFIHVNADGYVEPCPFSHYAADNVRNKPLVDILGSEFFCRLRDRFGKMPSPSGECLLFAHDDEVASIASETGAFSTEQGRFQDIAT